MGRWMCDEVWDLVTGGTSEEQAMQAMIIARIRGEKDVARLEAARPYIHTYKHAIQAFSIAKGEI